MIYGRAAAGAMCIMLLSGCVTPPPSDSSNVCRIFEEKRSWYKQVRRAAKRWDSDIAIIMAFIHQESRFVGNARPPRSKILWVLPGPRASNAYGYAQALNSTWDWYRKSSGRWGADRKDIGDAADFIGWYNRQSKNLSKIAVNDPYNLYLAYHEGHGGFNRKTFKRKAWLEGVAKKVESRSIRYRKQLAVCEEDLQKSWWWPF